MEAKRRGDAYDEIFGDQSGYVPSDDPARGGNQDGLFPSSDDGQNFDLFNNQPEHGRSLESIRLGALCNAIDIDPELEDYDFDTGAIKLRIQPVAEANKYAKVVKESQQATLVTDNISSSFAFSMSGGSKKKETGSQTSSTSTSAQSMRKSKPLKSTMTTEAAHKQSMAIQVCNYTASRTPGFQCLTKCET